MATKAKRVTAKQALAWATKRYGKEAIVREDPKALTKADKEPVRAELTPLNAELREMRKVKGFAADPEFQAKQKRASHLSGQLRAFRCSLGCVGLGGMFFMVKGQGDTWEEAIAEAEKRNY